MKHYVCRIDQDMGLSTFAKLRTYPDGKIMTKIIGMGPQKWSLNLFLNLTENILSNRISQRHGPKVNLKNISLKIILRSILKILRSLQRQNKVRKKNAPIFLHSNRPIKSMMKHTLPLSICTWFFKISISWNWFLNLILCLFWTWFLQATQAVKINFEID